MDVERTLGKPRVTSWIYVYLVVYDWKLSGDSLINNSNILKKGVSYKVKLHF